MNNSIPRFTVDGLDIIEIIEFSPRPALNSLTAKQTEKSSCMMNKFGVEVEKQRRYNGSLLKRTLYGPSK